MFIKQGIKEFVDAGVGAVHKDMKQLQDRGVPIPIDPHKLYFDSNAAALKYLMFLNMKWYGKVNDIGCGDGRSQRSYTHKDKSISHTVTTEYLIVSCVIYTMKQRTVATVDIPVAFLQADMDDHSMLNLID